MGVTTVRVGTDVESIDDVRESLELFGMRYANRVFTDYELESCGGATPAAASRLTARFAAKEAVMKMLAPVDLVPSWRSIEVRQLPGGAATVRLSGTAATLAADAGVVSISLSMSHGAGIGTATAIGVSTLPGRMGGEL